jgi:hypothetical protein
LIRKGLKNKYEELINGLLSGIGAFLGALIIFRENPISLFKNAIPLGGDGLLTGLYIKIVNESSVLTVLFGNIQSNQFGWPSKLNFNSYPIGSTLDILSIKLFMKISGITDPGQVIHIYSIGKAAVIAITVYIFVRTLNLNKWISISIAISYSLNTYNIVRAEGHFLLGLTWQIPIMLSASYLAFSNSHGYQNRKSNTRKLFALTALSFFAHFYYSIFWILINSFLSLVMVIKVYADSQGNESSRLEKLFLSIKQCRNLIYLTLASVMSFVLQIIPILLNQRNILSLSSTADRSPIESNVYSGDLESFFFDSYRFLFRVLGHPELNNYFANKISWEGSHFGVFSGVAAVCSFGLLFFHLIKREKSRKFSEVRVELQFVSLVLIVTFFFYLKSPLQFVLVQLLPQVRAWGRMSSFISLLLPILFFLLVKFYGFKKLVVVCILGTMTVLNLVEWTYIRADRPTSANLNVSSDLSKNNALDILDDFKERYPQDCGIFQVPVYPFPEFDTPDDSVNDYSSFLVSINDQKYFKWSYGGIKATENAKFFQQLYSEFPPFNRASLRVQLDYANSLGACAIFIDREALIKSETDVLQRLLNTYPEECIADHEFGNWDRFIEIDIFSKGCRQNANSSTDRLYSKYKNSDFLWRVDEPGNLQVTSTGTFFEAKTNLHVRLTPIDKTSKRIKIYFQSVAKNSQSVSPAKICISTNDLKVVRCKLSKNMNPDLFVVDFEMINKVEKLGKFILYLDPDWVTNNEIQSWAISDISR